MKRCARVKCVLKKQCGRASGREYETFVGVCRVRDCVRSDVRAGGRVEGVGKGGGEAGTAVQARTAARHSLGRATGGDGDR